MVRTPKSEVQKALIKTKPKVPMGSLGPRREEASKYSFAPISVVLAVNSGNRIWKKRSRQGRYKKKDKNVSFLDFQWWDPLCPL